jgi:propanol-preferring alcohol dehydrogenase
LGQPNAQGPDADFILVDARNCLSLPDELTFDDGAMIACIAGTCFSAARKLQPNGEDTVVIFGQGPVGLMGTLMVKAMGARVVAIDPVGERLELARDLGADHIINSEKTDPVTAVRGLLGRAGADAALETSGSAAAHQTLVDVLRENGRGVFVGLGATGPTVNLTEIIGRQLTLVGSFVMPIHYYQDLVDFMLQHGLSSGFQQMITHRFPLTQAVEAFRVADGGKAGKVVFAWD